MCLYIGNRNGFIAKKNIKVYKELQRNEDEKWVTPCQGWPIEFDKELVPDESSPEISECGFKWQLDGGALHAHLFATRDINCFEAIIPEGTRFWIQDNLTQVAAEKLVITQIKAKDGERTDLSDYYDLAADLRLKDGSRVKAADKFNIDDVIGIYAYDDQVVGLEVLTDKFSDDPISENIQGMSFEEAEKVECGFQDTQNLFQTNIKSPALDFIKKQGPEWYIPSPQELKKFSENLLQVNLARVAIGKKPLDFAWFWSSSIKDSERIWCVHSYGRWCWDYYYGRYWRWRYCVLPFLELEIYIIIEERFCVFPLFFSLSLNVYL